MTWRSHPLVEPLTEGTRGDGAHRGEVGVADFPAGVYPACSLHGALIRVGADPAIWRCLVHSCNAGAMTPTPWAVVTVAERPTDADVEQAKQIARARGWLTDESFTWERGPDGELLMPDGTPFYGRLETGGSGHVIRRSEP